MNITTFPKFAGGGRTASLLDEELILLGNDGFGTKGKYITIQRPRDGLLAMKYTIDEFPLRQFPHHHTSLVSKNTLAVIGGKFKSKGMLSKYTWTELSLLWTDGSTLNPNLIYSCNVKIASDVHIIFGGVQGSEREGGRGGSRQVLRVNTTAESAVELKSMSLKRVSHSCQLLTHDIVLLSGGLRNVGEPLSAIQPDELYNFNSQETIRILERTSSLRRYQHATSRLGNQIYAFGGIDSNNDITSKVAVFNAITSAWTEVHQVGVFNIMITYIDTFIMDVSKL